MSISLHPSLTAGDAVHLVAKEANIQDLQVQDDQLYMAVCFCYLVKSYTGQDTFHKVPEKHGHVYLVRLYSFRSGSSSINIFFSQRFSLSFFE